MPESDTERSGGRAKAYGVLLAGAVAIVSLVLLAITQEPKTAVSSPVPAKAAIVPQIADAKSEAEIIFRGKSLAVFRRNLVTRFPGEFTEIKVGEAQAVKKGDVLATYTLRKSSVADIEKILYPDAVLNLEQSIYDLKIKLGKLNNASLPIKKLELERAEKQRENSRALETKGLASADAVRDAERDVERVEKEIQEIEGSIKLVKATLKKSKEDLRFAESQQLRAVELLEWRGNRSYARSKLPVNKAFLKAPIDGKIIWISPMAREKSEFKAGFHAMTMARMDTIVVRCKVHELDLVKLKKGDRGTASFDAIPGKQYPCKINRMSWISRNPQLEFPADYDIECMLEDPDEKIKDGLTCNVRIGVTQ